ncbi:MAG: 1-aminocyclopropane-1-carboxylate deaminase/D-cysteine desulfhydrase [Polyangiaceae bacterium]
MKALCKRVRKPPSPPTGLSGRLPFESFECVSIGTYPTPVQRVEALSTPGCDFWVKRDDQTNRELGGNKVRKLEHLLADALEHGAKRLVTVGAAGSHHVLSTAYYGRRVGLEVEAVLVPQPMTDHVLDVLRAGIAQGLRVFPASTWAKASTIVVRRIAAGSRFLSIGGSSVTGSMGYVLAARELALQVRAGLLPEPDVCVVALGSGGTAAGLAAGFEVEGMKTRVAAMCVSEPPWAIPIIARMLARACVRRAGATAGVEGGLAERLSVNSRFLGGGYGHPTPEGARATAIAWRAAELSLDPTYTAKAFAGALSLSRARRDGNVLYWHTLSSAPMDPLLRAAPLPDELDPAVRALLIPC